MEKNFFPVLLRVKIANDFAISISLTILSKEGVGRRQKKNFFACTFVSGISDVVVDFFTLRGKKIRKRGSKFPSYYSYLIVRYVIQSIIFRIRFFFSFFFWGMGDGFCKWSECAGRIQSIVARCKNKVLENEDLLEKSLLARIT